MKLALFLVIPLLFSIRHFAEKDPGESNVVSTIALIGNPDKFHGKPIMTVGFLNLGRESNTIYVHREDFDRGITKNGIWLEISREQMVKYKDRIGKYVFIEGVFNANETGHFGMSSGAIEKIKRIDLYEK